MDGCSGDGEFGEDGGFDEDGGGEDTKGSGAMMQLARSVERTYGITHEVQVNFEVRHAAQSGTVHA